MGVNHCSILISALSQASTRQKPIRFAGRTCKATSPAFRSCPGHWWLEKLQVGEAAGFRASHSQVKPSSFRALYPSVESFQADGGSRRAKQVRPSFGKSCTFFTPISWSGTACRCIHSNPTCQLLTATHRPGKLYASILFFELSSRTWIQKASWLWERTPRCH